MKKVLFVDDNKILSRLSCDILRREGFQAVPAFSAEEALEAFEKEKWGYPLDSGSARYASSGCASKGVPPQDVVAT